MRTSQISATVVTMLALFAAGHARAEGVAGGGDTVRLDTVNKVWLNGDNVGPNRIGKLTGAGYMDASITFDKTASATPGTVTLLTTYTRSDTTRNQNAANDSYLQGGYSIAKLTEKGLELGEPVNLPKLNGDRAWNRPLVAFTPKYGVLVAASEDNNANNGNPRPVLYLIDKATGQRVKVANNNRGNDQKPFDLITALEDAGVNVQNANNQRGPHSVVPVTDNDFIISLQYNNQAQEAMRINISDNGEVTAKWLQRYSNNAVHSRAVTAYTPGAKEAYVTAIECNNQPADIGLRLTKVDIETGRSLGSKVVVQSQPNKNKYVAEPHIVDLGDKVALGYALSAKARGNRNGDNGHAGGANVSMLSMFSKDTLQKVGEDLVAPSAQSRHPGFFLTKFGSEEKPAIAAISGSATGQSAAFLQIIPVDGQAFGAKDPLKLYSVSTYSDVANLQARGKRNPNNQAKGFINGVGDVPNPGYDKAGGFYPEVKSFSISSVTGYSSPEAATKGLKESLWLSMVPSTWKPGLKTAPGVPNPNAGTGPAPVIKAAPTNENPNPPSTGPVTGGDATHADEGGDGDLAEANAGGCSVATPVSSSGAAGLLGLVLGAMALIRRRNQKESV
jgi:hypothetical protein